VSSWKFVEDIDIGDMEYGSGYPGGSRDVTVCCIRSVILKTKIVVIVFSDFFIVGCFQFRI